MDPAYLHDMQTRFDDHGALTRRNTTEQRPIPLSLATIEADEIDRWAGEHQARQELAVLLRRLVHSTTDDVKGADFPGYGQAERPGWDGRIEASASTSWVPEGASRWEFTCNSRPRTRANHYFKSRTQSVPLEARQEQTFVFVTPHNWSKKNEWKDEKQGLNEWRKVQAYDASDLEQWLETSPATQVWFAERLGRPVDGFQSLVQFWNEWAAAADPPLSPALFAAAVEEHSRGFFRWLEDEPRRLFTIAADSRQEAVAFLACLLEADSLPPGRMLDRAVVFQKPDAVQRLNSLMGGSPADSAENRRSFPLLAVAGTLDVEQSLAAWREACHCVAPQPRNAVGLIDRRRDIELDILTPLEFGKALASMNISGAKVDQLALDTARSPTILRRRLLTAPGGQLAGWARDEDALEAAVVPALIGAWNSGTEADREVLALLADTDYDEVENAVARLRTLEDPPVWSIGRYRGVCSRIDALFSVAPTVTTKTLDDFFFLAEYILAERNPALDLPDQDQWMAAVYDKVRDHSDALRLGIRETLILLAEHGDRLFDKQLGGNTEQRVAALVRRLLAPLTLETLLSHKDDFPDYAEATPDAVLDLLEEDLGKSEPAAFELLKSPEGDSFFQDCSRSGLLWALETLAWLPNHLPRVASILARLSELEITDRWTNTPFNSLVSLFRAWLPQTAARLPERLEVLDSIVRSRPQAGWRLCVELLPKRHDTADRNRLPKWRGDISLAHQRPPVTELVAAAEATRQTVFNWAGHDEETLGDLVDRVRSFSEGDREQVWDLIDRWKTGASDSARALLRDRIRRGNRAVPGERARQVIEALAPTDASLRNRWLFGATWDVELEESDEETPFDETLQRVKARREEGLREILHESEHDGLMELVECCEAPHVVGHTLTNVLDSKEVAELAIEILGKASQGLAGYRECLEGLLAPAKSVVLERLVRHCRKHEGADTRLVLYLAMPVGKDTWRLLEDEDQELRESYWKGVTPPEGRRVSADELNELVDGLLDARRPSVAFGAVQFSLAGVETKRLQRLLLSLARHGGESWPNSHFLGQTVEHLGSRVDVEESEIVKIEFALLPQLLHTERGFPNLQKRLLESPGLFVQAVALAFPPKTKDEDRSLGKMDDPKRRAAVRSAACQLLLNGQGIPGTRNDGELDVEKLRAWLAAARKWCAELDRAAVGDVMIGEWLARASAKDGVARPRSEVAEAIEWMASDDIDTGFRTGAYNARGVIMGFELGGDHDRVMAATYRGIATDMAEYPRMRRVLDVIAQNYEHEATSFDRSGEIANRLPSIGPVFPG